MFLFLLKIKTNIQLIIDFIDHYYLKNVLMYSLHMELKALAMLYHYIYILYYKYLKCNFDEVLEVILWFLGKFSSCLYFLFQCKVYSYMNFPVKYKLNKDIYLLLMGSA